MSFEVKELPHLPGEKDLWISHDGVDVNIHPWVRDDPGVYLQMSERDDYVNLVVPREEFVEALLAVFPELKRA